MNEKEIGELRRHLRADRCAVGALYACLVNEKKEIVTMFRQSFAQASSEDTDAVLSVMRKALSGAPGKNLVSLPFTTQQVMDSDEHRMFSALRKRDETGDAAIQSLFEQTAAALNMEGTYLILLVQDAYDVPFIGKDGEKTGEGDTVFSYALCAVCPLKETRPALGFFPTENALKSLVSNRVLSAPELGFLFPIFEDRAANIYDLLYYTKSGSENHPEFTETVAHIAAPMPADAQKETLQGVLEESLAESCSLKVGLELRDAICETLTAAKEEGAEELPVVTKRDVSRVLRESGVNEARVQTFEEKYTEAFGDAALPPKNLVNTRAIEVNTPDVQIKVNSDRSDLISTRTIDGVRYILIRAENGVEVSGMSVNIGEE